MIIRRICVWNLRKSVIINDFFALIKITVCITLTKWLCVSTLSSNINRCYYIICRIIIGSRRKKCNLQVRPHEHWKKIKNFMHSPCYDQNLVMLGKFAPYLPQLLILFKINLGNHQFVRPLNLKAEQTVAPGSILKHFVKSYLFVLKH